MKLLKIICLVLVAFTSVSLSITSSSDAKKKRRLTVTSWGGAYSASQITAFLIPFRKEAGVLVRRRIYNGGLEELREQAKSKKDPWDVVDMELADVGTACKEGLLEKIDPAELAPGPNATPAAADFIKGTLHDCAVGNIVWSSVIVFSSKKFGDSAPATLADFFDVAKYSGKRGMRKSPRGTLEVALQGDGVRAAEIYQQLATPAGVERAFRKLNSIRKHIVWWTIGAQPEQYLKDKRVVMTTAYAARMFSAVVAKKKPLKIIWDGQIWNANFWAIPKAARNKEVAKEFLKFATSPQQMALQTKYIAYAPTRKSAIAQIGLFKNKKTEMTPFMATAPQNFKTALQNDPAFWARHGDDLQKKFDSWLANETDRANEDGDGSGIDSTSDNSEEDSR